MAGIPSCIYKVVNLVAGEQFVLPPTADLISVTDDSLISSSCGDTLPVLPIKCYKIEWPITFDSDGAMSTGIMPVNIPESNNAWDVERDGDSINITSVSIGGTVSSTNIDCRSFSAIEGAIEASSSGPLLMNRKYKHVRNVDNAQTGGPLSPLGFESGYDMYTIYFKTIDTLSTNTYFEFLSSTGNVGSVPRYFPQEVDCGSYPTTSDLGSC